MLLEDVVYPHSICTVHVILLDINYGYKGDELRDAYVKSAVYSERRCLAFPPQ